MGSIYGVSLKGVKHFKGHEGEPCVQGNIYLNNKKIGYYSDSYMMGYPDIDVNTNQEELLEIAKKALKNFPYGFAGGTINMEDLYESGPIEGLMGILVDIVVSEAEFKKCKKKGYAYYAMCKKTEHAPVMTYYIPNLKSMEELENEIVLFKASSLDDFIIK